MAIQGLHAVVACQVCFWKAVDGAFQSVGLDNASYLRINLISIEINGAEVVGWHSEGVALPFEGPLADLTEVFPYKFSSR